MQRTPFRPFRFLIQVIAALGGTAIILSLLVLWRLDIAPLTSTSLDPYISSSIVSVLPGSKVAILHSLVSWNNQDRSVSVHAEGISVQNGTGPILEVPVLDLKMTLLGLITGKVIPSGLKVESPRIWLQRRKDGSIFLGGVAPDTSPGKDTRAVLINLIDDLSHAHYLRRLEVENAVALIHDEGSSQDWQIDLKQALLDRSLGGRLNGEAKIEIAQNASKASIDLHYDYAHLKNQDLLIDFYDLNPSILAAANAYAAMVDIPLSGHLELGFDDALSITKAKGRLEGGLGSLDYPTYWDQPLPIKRLSANILYAGDTKKFSLSAFDVDFDGPKLTSMMTADPTLPGSDEFKVYANAKLVDVPMSSLNRIWPKTVVDGARKWMLANLTNGRYDSAEITMQGKINPAKPEDATITSAHGLLAGSNATINYLDGMPPLIGVDARGTFDLKQMTINLFNGGIDDLKLLPSTVELLDLDREKSGVDVNATLTGPIPSVLKLIDAPRLRYASAVGLLPSSVSGDYKGSVQLKFPLLQNLAMKDIDVHVKGNLDHVASQALVPGASITDGVLALDVTRAAFTLAGTAALNTVPVSGTWTQAITTSPGTPLREASFKGNLNQDALKALKIDVFQNVVGQIPVDIALIQKEPQSTKFSGKADFQSSSFEVERLNWTKPAGQAATFEFEGSFEKGKPVEIKSLEGTGEKFNLKGSALLSNATFAPTKIDFDQFQVGKDDAALHFSQPLGPGSPLSLSVDGAAFDLTGIRNAAPDSSADQGKKSFSARLRTLYTGDYGVITNVEGKAERDGDGWTSITLKGLADGTHPLDIELLPNADGHITLNVSCEDFGLALRSLNLTDTIRNGTLKITGASSVEKPRVIEGKIAVGHFDVKGLPMLVVLMNATSPFGIINLFNGSLSFDHLFGDFHWLPSELNVKNVRASGSSVGITVDGKLNLNESTADLEGTVAPFSMVNRIINYVPIIGKVLTGGEGQGVLGVHYTVSGPLEKPHVSVNPISLLTPGFLRNLFFGSEDTSDDTDDPKQKKAP